MRNPTKAQRTAAAKEMIRAAVRYSDAYDGYVETDDGNIVVISDCSIYVGRPINGVEPAEAKFGNFKWQKKIDEFQKIHRTMLSGFRPEAVSDALNRQRDADRTHNGVYRKHSARVMYPLESGEQIGFDCERLLSACKMVGNCDYYHENNMMHQPVMFLPQTPTQPCMLAGEYGTVYLLPCRMY